MAYFVKVIPPSKRARIHERSCRHCREGRGQENQDKGSGPTYWSQGFATLPEAQSFMTKLRNYADTGLCAYCKPERPSDASRAKIRAQRKSN